MYNTRNNHVTMFITYIHSLWKYYIAYRECICTLSFLAKGQHSTPYSFRFCKHFDNLRSCWDQHEYLTCSQIHTLSFKTRVNLPLKPVHVYDQHSHVNVAGV